MYKQYIYCCDYPGISIAVNRDNLLEVRYLTYAMANSIDIPCTNNHLELYHV